MRITWRGKDGAAGCRVFDATGTEHEGVIWLDTESGELERYVLDEGEIVVIPVVDVPKTERLCLPVPFRFEPLPETQAPLAQSTGTT